MRRTYEEAELVSTMLITGLCMIASGCITDATTNSHQGASFDATSQLTNGTTAALSEFTDPLTDFTEFDARCGREGRSITSVETDCRSSRRLPMKTSAQIFRTVMGNIWYRSPHPGLRPARTSEAVQNLHAGFLQHDVRRRNLDSRVDPPDRGDRLGSRIRSAAVTIPAGR